MVLWKDLGVEEKERHCEAVHVCFMHEDADDSEEELMDGGMIVVRIVDVTI